MGVRVPTARWRAWCSEKTHDAGQDVSIDARSGTQGRRRRCWPPCDWAEDPAQEKLDRRASITVGELIDLFDAQYVGPMLKPGTAVSHRIALEELRGAHGTLKATAFDPGTGHNPSFPHGGSALCRKSCRRSLVEGFRVGGRWGLVPEGHNPVKGVKKYREQGRERFLTMEELARLGDTLREGETIGLPYSVDETKPKAKHAAKTEHRRVKLDRYASAALRLLILTGARLREILHAKWEQVDVERGIIFLSDSKTGKKPLYLSAAAHEVLADIPRIEGNPHVIAGAKDGAPRSDLKKPWAAVSRAAGLEGVRIHDLRHSFASFGAGASLGLPIIGKLLGHSQPGTTARYAHLDADPMRRAANTIGATISAAMLGPKERNVVTTKKSIR